MQAIVISKFGGLEVLEHKTNLEIPKLNSHQVLVEVKAIGINPVDTYIRSGAFGPVQFPHILGTDGAGIIAAVGGDVKKYKPGDHIYFFVPSHAYASHLVANESQIHPLPAKYSFAQGAALGIPYLTALRAFLQLGKKVRKIKNKGITPIVLIHGGSGGVGIASIQIAHVLGYTTFATASTDEGRKLMLEQGADKVFDHSDPTYLQQIKAAAKARDGVDLILEMLGNVNINADLDLVNKFGGVIIIGSRGDGTISPVKLMGKDSYIKGLLVFNMVEKEFEECFEWLDRNLAEGKLNPIVGRELPLKDAAVAHKDILEKKAFGKIVLKP